MNLASVVTFIRKEQLSPSDRRELYDALKESRTSAAVEMTLSLRPGDRVSVQDRGRQLKGVVEKVNVTTAIVLVDGVKWRVPANLLTKMKGGRR